ncbi:hypothetical protein KJ763_02120 [Patescibacteria group bacterium]|nr:hypothetical protein [Patescibacteria group bacterium]
MKRNLTFVLLFIISAVMQSCAFDDFMRKIHNAPEDGVYKTQYATVRFENEDWSVADMIDERVDEIILKVAELLEVDKQTLPKINIVLYNGFIIPNSVCRCDGYSCRENEFFKKAGCYSFGSKIIYLARGRIDACVLGHEITHVLVNHCRPGALVEDQEQIATYIENNLPYSCDYRDYFR